MSGSTAVGASSFAKALEDRSAFAKASSFAEASSFAKASSFAEATEDRPEDGSEDGSEGRLASRYFWIFKASRLMRGRADRRRR